MAWSRNCSIWLRRTHTSRLLPITASCSEKRDTSDTVPCNMRRFSKCRLSRGRSDEAAGLVLGSLRCGAADSGGASSAWRFAVGLYRAGRGIRIPRIVFDAAHVAGPQRRLAVALAVPDAVAARAQQAGIPQGTCEKGDFSRIGWFRSRPGGAVHGGRQTAESEQAQGAGILHEAADYISGTVAGCMVDFRHRCESGEAQHLRFSEPRSENLRAGAGVLEGAAAASHLEAWQVAYSAFTAIGRNAPEERAVLEDSGPPLDRLHHSSFADHVSAG